VVPSSMLAIGPLLSSTLLVSPLPLGAHAPPLMSGTMARAVRAGHPLCLSTDAVAIKHRNPLPALQPRDVIDTVMAALHRSNWETPTPYYGFEVALRFFAPTHQAKLRNAKPAGFARYMQRPHKISQLMWNEFRFDGDVVFISSDDGVKEAYQTVSLRASPDDEWQSSRWKLVQIEFDYGTTVTPPTWLVEHVFVGEPDTPEDIEFLKSQEPEESEPQVLNWNGVVVSLESPRVVVNNVMRALRKMDEPYPLHGAVVATRYCSPRNRASELSPEVFARYLQEDVYSVLAEWDEMQFDEDEDEDEAEAEAAGSIEHEVLVRRTEQDSFSIVTWALSSYEGQWLIDSMTITE